VRVCEERRKRDVSHAIENFDDLYPLAQGPISLDKKDAGRQSKNSRIKTAGKT